MEGSACGTKVLFIHMQWLEDAIRHEYKKINCLGLADPKTQAITLFSFFSQFPFPPWPSRLAQPHQDKPSTISPLPGTHCCHSSSPSTRVLSGFGGCVSALNHARSRQAQMVPPRVCQGVGTALLAGMDFWDFHLFRVMGTPGTPGIYRTMPPSLPPSLPPAFIHPKLPQKAAQQPTEILSSLNFAENVVLIFERHLRIL